MITYVQYLWNRYMGEKGQGLTEYAIILLLVVIIGLLIYTQSGLKGQIQGLYSTIGTNLSTLENTSTASVT